MMTEISIENIMLQRGAHKNPQSGMCVMELSSYLAREPFSDHPACVSPVLGSFLRPWSDSLDDDTRQKLKPYAAKVLNTAGSEEAETRRSWMAVDWLIRTYTPAWLDLAGLNEHASALRAFPEIVSTAGLPLTEIQSARGAAEAAWDAAGDVLSPVVATLQESALELLGRMIEVYKK